MTNVIDDNVSNDVTLTPLRLDLTVKKFWIVNSTPVPTNYVLSEEKYNKEIISMSKDESEKSVLNVATYQKREEGRYYKITYTVDE